MNRKQTLEREYLVSKVAEMLENAINSSMSRRDLIMSVMSDFGVSKKTATEYVELAEFARRTRW